MHAHDLSGATLQVVPSWSAGWALALRRDGEEVGEVRRGEGGRVVLELEGSEWWSWWEGIRVVRGWVTDAEREPLLIYAGTLLSGAALERRGLMLTYLQADKGTVGRRPATFHTRIGREAFRAAPGRPDGRRPGWILSLDGHPALADALPPLLALWGGLIVTARTKRWLTFTTLGVPTRRIEAVLEDMHRSL